MSTTETSERAQRLRELLRELFQYDRADLDFGIYRILNQRRDEIDRFLDDDLLPAIEAAFALDPEAARLADETCADLARFFERYYDEGDFLSLRRYRKDTYVVPYEGQEVLLHWANRDQYYIKSFEHLSGMAFRLEDGRRVRLVVVATDELAGNAKPAPGDERRFALDAACPVELSEDELVIRFIYVKAERGLKQKNLDADAIEQILSMDGLEAWAPELARSAPTDKDPDRTLLARHVTGFTARNARDYFVHKDLGGFLRRELDFFLKNEVLQIDELVGADAGDSPEPEQLAQRSARARIVRRIASDVIAFLAQVEEFQKRLWLKKKFVLETSWLITLDQVPEELWLEVAANDAQREAWVDVLALDQIEASLDQPGYSEPLTLEFLAANPHLVLDTRHFDDYFTDRLIGSISDLDDTTLGVLVHGENFQALNLLERRYREQVSIIYIDPPYNTGGDGFLYKDAYQHASWMAMMQDRLELGRALLARDGALVASIDDGEHARLRLLMDSVFGPDNFVANVIWQKKYAPANDAKWFSDDHDHLPFYARDKDRWHPLRLARTDAQNDAYKNPDDDPRGAWMSDNYTSNKSAAERPNLFYAITNPNTGEEIWPRPSRVWGYGPEQHQRHVEEERLWWGADGTNSTPRLKRFLSEVGAVVPRTVWLHGEAGHNQDAVRDLHSLFDAKPFASPKPLRLMRRILAVSPGNFACDFFAGSGTFGQAIIDEVREGGNRKFLLVESGPHAETVARPRMIKALHSGDWADGVPQSRSGVSGIIKCLALESYEDALDAVQLMRTESQSELLVTNTEVRRDYLLRYLLDREANQALLADGALSRPAAYTALATIDGETRTVSVDIAETFSYLLGLRVRTHRVIDGVRVIAGTDAAGRSVLAIWRDGDVVDNATLDSWFEGLDPALRRADLDVIYVNGDCTLDALRRSDEGWAVRLAEDEFHHLMFEVADLERA